MPGPHSDMPVSELTEHDTRAIKASDVSSTPSVVETVDGVTITKTSRPSTEPPLWVGTRGKLDSQGDQIRGRRTMAQILGRGYVRKQETFSPTNFAILSSIFSDNRAQQRQGVESHSGTNRSTYTKKHFPIRPFFFMTRPRNKSCQKLTMSKTGRNAKSLRPDSYGIACSPV